ncbi:hypothetical protein O7627_26895 [Solwaraspora sp. WMMD1047]|nr:hypothetical protein [Solwaraspora sp. WMMD1047]MDG4832907.1 hypothetical protein [Solwaraspora sp. WMMD1047]
MLLLILMVALATVVLISFFGSGRTSNRTVWIVAGAFLLVGLLLAVGA